MLTTPALDRIPGLKHGFFTRRGGVSDGVFASLNCAFGSGDSDEYVTENRTRAAARLGAADGAVITLSQRHTDTTVIIAEPIGPNAVPIADALVTQTPGLIIGVLTADCAPVLLVDPERRIIAACHAGSRGALAGIIGSTVRAMTSLGAVPSDILAAIGPCIHKPSYDVGPDFRSEFLAVSSAYAAYFAETAQPESWLFDLPRFVGDQLAETGITTIFPSLADTCASPDLFFSYRYAGQTTNGICGRQLSAITLAP